MDEIDIAEGTIKIYCYIVKGAQKMGAFIIANVCSTC